MDKISLKTFRSNSRIHCINKAGRNFITALHENSLLILCIRECRDESKTFNSYLACVASVSLQVLQERKESRGRRSGEKETFAQKLQHFKKLHSSTNAASESDWCGAGSVD